MPSQADQQFAEIYDQDADFFGISVRIQRGASVSSSVTAIVDEDVEMIGDIADGIGTKRKTRNYTIAKSDYLVAGAAAEPRAGDLILETINSMACKFEVIDGSESQPSHEREHPDGVRWVVRTQQVK